MGDPYAVAREIIHMVEAEVRPRIMHTLLMCPGGTPCPELPRRKILGWAHARQTAYGMEQTLDEPLLYVCARTVYDELCFRTGMTRSAWWMDVAGAGLRTALIDLFTRLLRVSDIDDTDEDVWDALALAYRRIMNHCSRVARELAEIITQ